MSTSLLERAETRTDNTTITTAAQRLRTTMAAVRVSFTWFGVSKSLTPEQRATAAERLSTRRFQVDVDLTWDLNRSMETDRLADTINYYDVCQLIVGIGESRPYRLLEKLAAEMVRAIQERWPPAISPCSGPSWR